MCWVALDRGDRAGRQLGAADRVPALDRRPATRSGRAILTQGWSEQRRRVHPVVRLRRPRRVEPDDRRSSGSCPPTTRGCCATIDAIARAAHRRARPGLPLPGADDGLAGEEGTFLLCTFWLAQALALAGEADRARTTFERADRRYANDVGLLAEEVDPATGELLGNFPQAFSHIGLVNAAWAISQAERKTAGGSASQLTGGDDLKPATRR